MSGHTPGPWVATVDPHACASDDWCIGSVDGKIDNVAVCSKRDAHLIAAAPDLLEALKMVRDYVVTMKGKGHEYQIVIDAAIAKATNQQGNNHD